MAAGGYRLTGLSKGSEASPGLQFTADTNLGLRSSGADILEIVTAGADRWQVNASGHLLGVDDNTYDIGATGATRPRTGYFGTSVVVPTVIAATSIYVNETANTKMTTGLTINQGAADDEIFALKSSDVAHGMTDIAETDTYGNLGKNDNTGGGLTVHGLTDADAGAGAAIRIVGTLGTAADTTKSTAAVGVVDFLSRTKNAAGVQAVGADGNLVTIGNNGTTRFIFDAEGSGHADTAWTTFGEHDDVVLVRTVEEELVAHETPDRTARRRMLEDVGIIGKDSWHLRNGRPHAMVNFTKLAMLHHGALLQVAQRLDRIERKVLNADN